MAFSFVYMTFKLNTHVICIIIQAIDDGVLCLTERRLCLFEATFVLSHTFSPRIHQQHSYLATAILRVWILVHYNEIINMYLYYIDFKLCLAYSRKEEKVGSISIL